MMVVLISCLEKFLISCFAKFSSNFMKFKIILSQFRVSRNFDNAVSQPPYVGVEKGGRAAGTALAHPPG